MGEYADYALEDQEEGGRYFSPSRPKFTKKPVTTYPNWINCSQELRDQIIADFEQSMYEAYGQFPVANWKLK